MKYKSSYYRIFGRIIKKEIKKKYGRKIARLSYSKGKKEYKNLVNSAPPLKDNSLIVITYFTYTYLAFYQGSEKKVNPSDLGKIMNKALKSDSFLIKVAKFIASKSKKKEKVNR